jgi:alkylhydroperoxidase family enzyme
VGERTLPPGFVVEPVSEAELKERYPDRPGGKYPNSIRIMGRDPELTEAWSNLARVVAFRPGKVDRALKWLVGHVASRAAGCRYCTAHSVMFASNETDISVEKIEAVWDFESSPLFSEAERAALRWGRAAGASPNEVTREHYDELHRFFDDDQIVEMAAVVCMYGWMNRWNDTFMTPLEDEPLAFGDAHLAASGWDPGRHAPAAT